MLTDSYLLTLSGMSEVLTLDQHLTAMSIECWPSADGDVLESSVD